MSAWAKCLSSRGSRTRRITARRNNARRRIASSPSMAQRGGSRTIRSPERAGSGGSFIPPFADAVVAKENVPVGIIACGIGATSVREWLPKGADVSESADARRPRAKAPQRPVGEQRRCLRDVRRADEVGGPARLPRRALASRRERCEPERPHAHAAGQTLPRVSGAVSSATRDATSAGMRRGSSRRPATTCPAMKAATDIRAAQASLWRDGIALEGPDSDALKGKLRERDGQGVHFSGEGLREHGAKWAEKVLPWLDRQWTEPRTGGRRHGMDRLCAASRVPQHRLGERERAVQGHQELGRRAR